ncbi:MAG: hypothetical protein Q9162_004788 [Coniocarpon cinnabarinum]
MAEASIVMLEPSMLKRRYKISVTSNKDNDSVHERHVDDYLTKHRLNNMLFDLRSIAEHNVDRMILQAAQNYLLKFLSPGDRCNVAKAIKFEVEDIRKHELDASKRRVMGTIVEVREIYILNKEGCDSVHEQWVKHKDAPSSIPCDNTTGSHGVEEISSAAKGDKRGCVTLKDREAILGLEQRDALALKRPSSYESELESSTKKAARK